MSIFFLLVGFALLTAAERGNVKKLVAQVESDFSPFLVWIVLIISCGVVRQSNTLKPVANGFLVLIVVAFILRNGAKIASEFVAITKPGSKTAPVDISNNTSIDTSANLQQIIDDASSMLTA